MTTTETPTSATNLDDPTPVYAYVSTDGRHIIEFDGTILGSIRSSSPIRLARLSWVHGSHMSAYVARMADGRDVYGRSSPGLAITLRPYRNQRATR